MIGFTSEITGEVSFGRPDHHLYLCSQMKQVWQSAFRRGTDRGYEPTTQRMRNAIINSLSSSQPFMLLLADGLHISHPMYFDLESRSSIDCYHLSRCCLSISFWVSLLLVFLLWVSIRMLSWPTWCCSFRLHVLSTVLSCTALYDIFHPCFRYFYLTPNLFSHRDV